MSENTATTRTAYYAKVAADEAATALACFTAAAELPHHFEIGAEGNERFALTLQGIHAVNRARDASADAAGEVHTFGGTPTTAAYASAASTAYHEAQDAQDNIQALDLAESRAWRKAQREANADGSFAH